MLEILKTEYTLKNPKLQKLIGYDSTNYLVENQSMKFILKIYSNNKKEVELAEAENALLLHLQKAKNNRFPAPVKNRNKQYITPFFENNEKKYARLLTYLEGAFLGETDHSATLFKTFGKFIAELDLQLQSFSNPVIEARQFKWDLQHFLLNEKYLQYITNSADRKTIELVFDRYKTNVLPVLPNLRKQIIHNDANEWNTLTTKNKVTGLIDFGDICYTQLVNEPAIALAYALLGKANPVKWATPILSEYNKTIALYQSEVYILYHLIAARLCTTVLNSAFERVNRPENRYIQISEKLAWPLLKMWTKTDPEFVGDRFWNTLKPE